MAALIDEAVMGFMPDLDAGARGAGLKAGVANGAGHFSYLSKGRLRSFLRRSPNGYSRWQVRAIAAVPSPDGQRNCGAAYSFETRGRIGSRGSRAANVPDIKPRGPLR